MGKEKPTAIFGRAVVGFSNVVIRIQKHLLLVLVNLHSSSPPAAQVCKRIVR